MRIHEQMIKSEKIANSEARILRNRNRRKKQLQRKMLTLGISCLLILFLVIGCFSFGSVAKEDSADNIYKYYTSIEVKTGDTLLSIAEKYAASHYDSYEDYIEEVIFINSLRDEKLRPGSYLIVPYHSGEFKI